MRPITWIVLTVAVLPVAALADATVATVGGRTITRSELEKHVQTKLVEIENSRYEALQEGLEEMIAEELMQQEAKARGVSVAALEQQEVTSKITEPDAAMVQKLYDENKEQLQGAPLETVKPQIIEFIKQQQAGSRKEAFIQELKAKYKTTTALERPVIEVGTGGRPSRGGGANAPVTIIAFSDYECPFCKRAEQTVEQVMKAYGDKVRLVHRDFPLSFHQHALEASEAARCAEAQGKFWEYHTKLFASTDLSTEALKKLADEVGLDRAKFDDCLTKQSYKAGIDQDIADGSKVGVSGTPAFFINGHLLSGAQPFEKFKEVIDAELAHGKKS